MPDTADLFNPPPPPPIRWLRHPFVLIFLALILYGIGHFIYRLMLPASATVPTVAKPNGDWTGEITMDGRNWNPTQNGDTPGPHRHAVFHFSLETTDNFLDHHAGDGTLEIVGENIKRPIRAYDWELSPDGSLRFGFLSTPTLFSDDFRCQVDGTNITCKSDDQLKPHLTLHPGSPAQAATLLQQITERAANETPLPAVQEEDDGPDDLSKQDEPHSFTLYPPNHHADLLGTIRLVHAFGPPRLWRRQAARCKSQLLGSRPPRHPSPRLPPSRHRRCSRMRLHPHPQPLLQRRRYQTPRPATSRPL